MTTFPARYQRHWLPAMDFTTTTPVSFGSDGGAFYTGTLTQDGLRLKGWASGVTYTLPREALTFVGTKVVPVGAKNAHLYAGVRVAIEFGDLEGGADSEIVRGYLRTTTH